MRLAPEQRKQFYYALLTAFPTREALNKLLLLELGENLDTITLGQSLAEDVLALISWAEARGRIQDLITGARTDHPGNEELQIFAEAFDVSVKTLPFPVVTLSGDLQLQATRENLIDL